MNDHADVKRARLLNAALHDLSRLLEAVAGLYRVAYLHNAVHLARPQAVGAGDDWVSSGAVHVDVRWLSEVVDDVNNIAACLAANNYSEARRQGSDLAHGIASLAGHRRDGFFESGHSWENARHFVHSVSQQWDSEVIPALGAFVGVLDALVQKFAALDELCQPAGRSGSAT